MKYLQGLYASYCAPSILLKVYWSLPQYLECTARL